MKNIKIEICCGSADDVIAAYKAGADRAELNSDLFHGGLTPTIGALRIAVKYADIPVICMVRPREGGFCYTDIEFETSLCDAKLLLNNGAGGIVFGFLKADGTVDEDRCRAMLDVIGNKDAVFHRAIDVTPDWRKALDALIDLGVTRVLSSGQSRSALLGSQVLAEMVGRAAGRIEILPGAGINPDNARQIMKKTGCGQLHMSMHKTACDDSAGGNPDISFVGKPNPENLFKVIDDEKLARFTNSFN
jgi:copper homeostasis protein